jgi:polysaccharide deacetylase 2 family uncharacterized protein YibQ
LKKKKKPSPATRRKRRRASRKTPSTRRVLIWLTLFLSLIVGIGILSDYYQSRQRSSIAVAPKPKQPEPEPSVAIQPPKQPPFEIYPQKDHIKPSPVPKPPVPSKGQRPRIAIIIDDIGYDKSLADQFIGLNVPLTIAILPHSPHGSKIADQAAKHGTETMLHLPMEPKEYPRIHPGPGVLLETMSPDELIAQLEKNIDAIPNIKGVNNHMGSRLTASSNQLYQIFTVLKKRKLYFVDSRTTPDTLCRPSARLFKVPFAERDVFLDNSQKRADIQKQFDKLISIAKQRGQAVGIGHPYQSTYEVLRQYRSLLQEDAMLVKASQIVTTPG